MYETTPFAEQDPAAPAGAFRPPAVVAADAGLRPEAFLRAAGGWPRGFWRRGDRWSAFAGSAATVRLPDGRRGRPEPDRFGRTRRRAARLLERSGARADLLAVDRPRLYGGFSFGEDGGSAPWWTGFPAARFVLPALEARAGPEGVRILAWSAGGNRPTRKEAEENGASAGGRTTRVEALLRRLADPEDDLPSEGGAEPPAVEAVRSPGTKDQWTRSVRRVLEAVRGGRVSKVVLARPLDLELASAPDPLVLLARLRRSNPLSYAFYLEPEPGTVFLGAAPELVGALEGRSFLATAVAGTIRRGRDAAEDEVLARRLLASAKDRDEHRIGVEEMADRLGALARGARVDRAPRVVKQNRVQHLRTDLTLEFPDDVHILDLVSALHPPAAVCGHPRNVALRILRQEEGFDRGWYAAPVGWLDVAGDGEFAPGLRCGVLQGTRIRLFAGAGIVEGSDPGREWEETRLKFGPMLEVLGAEAG